MKKRKKRLPAPDKLPGKVRYRKPMGKKGERPLERIKRQQPPERESKAAARSSRSRG